MFARGADMERLCSDGWLRGKVTTIEALGEFGGIFGTISVNFRVASVVALESTCIQSTQEAHFVEKS